MDESSKHQELQTTHIDTVMKNIERYCGYESEEGPEPVNLFKDVLTPDRTNAEHQANYAANMVFDGMMYTLNEIGAYAAEKAKGIGETAKEYEGVLMAIEALTNVSRALADDQVLLERNLSFEKMLKEEGDTVYSYRARNTTIGEKLYREVRVFIRPNRYERPLQLRNQRPGARISEIAQARMSIDLIPVDITQSAVHIRTDQEDALHDYEITYDIEIGKGEINLMDILDFSGSGASRVNTGQRQGHHFSSSLTAKEFGTTFTDILEASNRKFAAKADSVIPSQKPTITSTY